MRQWEGLARQVQRQDWQDTQKPRAREAGTAYLCSDVSGNVLGPYHWCSGVGLSREDSQLTAQYSAIGRLCGQSLSRVIWY